ncbi:EAL domain-containing protein [Lacisediminimonas profundi]|uniref:EAL domain-containing protein n=1 Tax=Lacisediminimonas profundi TaxID=2603856 RepID=UPI0019D5253F|nr:EAL domain-containing protein [Lacisediminimonas profundi]
MASLESYRQYERAISDAYRDASSIRIASAAHTEQFLAQSRIILAELARHPRVKALDPAGCDPELAALKERQPAYANVLTLNASGKLVCSANPIDPKAPNRPDPKYYFDEVARTHEFTVGKPAKGFLSGRWVSTLAYPILNETGKFAGVVAVSVDLVNYAPLLPEAKLPPNTVIGIANGEGVIIARSVDAAARVGVKSDAEGVKIMVRDKLGTLRSSDHQGNKRLYSFAPVALSDWIIFVSLDEAAVISPAVRLALERIAYILAILLLIVMSTIALARRFARQIKDIFNVMSAIRRGDVHARVNPTGSREMRQIATQLNEMLDARLQAEVKLRASEELFHTAFQTSPDAIVITELETGRYLEVNNGFTRLVGWTRNEVIGKRAADIKGWRHIADRDKVIYTLKRDGTVENLEADFVTRDGKIVTTLMSAQVITLNGKQCVLSVNRDITARKRAEAQIHSLAYFDPLTTLPNRRLFMDRLTQVLLGKALPDHFGALAFVDLDDFKTLNESRGHEQGDLLLKQVASRISNCIRKGDTVARIGGDDFVVLMENLGPRMQEAATQAKLVSEMIHAALNQPYDLGGSQVSQGSTYQGTSSIGIALLDGQFESATEPLKRAELAMYRAKAAGRGNIFFFDPAMQDAVTARADLETALRESIAENQLFLNYQAQVTDKEIILGAEVLVRWQHPRFGLVSPADFIPLAEETGLILPLGQWVLEAACKQLARWRNDSTMANLTLSVNVSSRQFHQDDFVHQVTSALERSGANPHRLKLELTESMLVTDIDIVSAKMRALKARGVGFSLDDFGTGYSSLAYLKRLPLDQLKIDQGFVRDILVDRNDAAIARMVIALADSMELTVIAEGVGTAAQRDALARLGCHTYQGYLYSRPLPVQEFEAFVQNGGMGSTSEQSRAEITEM